MRAFWFDNKDVGVNSSRLITLLRLSNLPPQGDQRLPHDSGRSVDPNYLSKLGVLYYHILGEQDVDKLATERKYKNRDQIIVSPDKMGDVYEEKVKMFFNEHMHEDEEIRYIEDGTGYFDVRSEEDEWVRIFLEKDDLIVRASCCRDEKQREREKEKEREKD